jgi:hypothetical protein
VGVGAVEGERPHLPSWPAVHLFVKPLRPGRILGVDEAQTQQLALGGSFGVVPWKSGAVPILIRTAP